ncbi:hypothetical protein GFA90_02930 [Escherichia coli]|nr:hypothetical protein [Escherichia coli]
MFAGKKSAQIREILISESAWEEMTCLFAPSLRRVWRPCKNMAADRLFHFFKTSGFHHQFHLRHSDTFFGIFSRNVDS